MLDIRIETFLKLCETGSYTKTAFSLHVTQPTVTQHIQYLEKKYNAQLVTYAGRLFELTEKGKQLRAFALAMQANNQKIDEVMKTDNTNQRKINFGSTLTIGEYVMPDKISDYLMKYPDTYMTMLVDNTKDLLKKLESGIIDFAIVEGNFDKEKYGFEILKQADFICVCAKHHPFAQNQKILTFKELLEERLIIREEGSGTRDILENILHENNLGIESFKRKVEFGNFNAIKNLVGKSMGITFVYSEVVKNELVSGEFVKLEIENMNIKREFNIVYLKDDIQLATYKEFWNFIQKVY